MWGKTELPLETLNFELRSCVTFATVDCDFTRGPSSTFPEKLYLSWWIVLAGVAVDEILICFWLHYESAFPRFSTRHNWITLVFVCVSEFNGFDLGYFTSSTSTLFQNEVFSMTLL